VTASDAGARRDSLIFSGRIATQIAVSSVGCGGAVATMLPASRVATIQRCSARDSIWPSMMLMSPTNSAIQREFGA
jgi:hypothetical protein